MHAVTVTVTSYSQDIIFQKGIIKACTCTKLSCLMKSRRGKKFMHKSSKAADGFSHPHKAHSTMHARSNARNSRCHSFTRTWPCQQPSTSLQYMQLRYTT